MLLKAYVAGYHGHILSGTHRFLATLLHDPPDRVRIIDIYFGRITCLLGWGTEDPVIAGAENACTLKYSLSPVGPLANALPALM